MIELKAQINSLKNKIQGLEDVDIGDKAMEYRVLEREVQTNKRMYEILLTRLKEIDVSSNLNVNNISIIDRAQVPEKPIKPNLKLNMMLAIMAGLVMGTGLAFFVDYLDTTIKSPEDIKEILGSHFLGAIPEMKEEDELKRDKMAYLEAKSPISESYKAIRTDLCQLMTQGENLKTILATSAEPQAGKTMTVSNLGITLAQRGGRVLLVDSDLRKPQLHRIFNLERKLGLSEYLRGEANIDSIVKGTEVENLKVITCGEVPRNPAETIACPKMQEFLVEAKERFDFIIFDSPPLISVTDAVILANLVDVLIQIIRSGKTLVPIALRAKEQLSQVKAKNLGVILNGIKTFHGNYYYYYRYYNYYGEDRRRSESTKELPWKSKKELARRLGKTWDTLKSDSRKAIYLIKDRINTYKNSKLNKKED
jgi:capsular exopolysaccharide synthesis family protein